MKISLLWCTEQLLMIKEKPFVPTRNVLYVNELRKVLKQKRTVLNPKKYSSSKGFLI